MNSYFYKLIASILCGLTEDSVKSLRYGTSLVLIALLLAVQPMLGATIRHRAVNPYFVTINVMFLYPPEALSYATAEQLHAYCVAKVDSVNQIIRTSGKGTKAQYRLAWDQVSDEAPLLDRTELLWMAQSKYVATLRYVHQADLVGYLPVHPVPGDPPDLANCPPTLDQFTPDAGFFVAVLSLRPDGTPAPEGFTTEHEMLHPLGLNHQPSGVLATSAEDGPNARAREHVIQELCSQGVMGTYIGTCNGVDKLYYNRLPWFSNPNLTWQGYPTGTPTEDNASMFSIGAERVSHYREKLVLPSP